MSKTTELEYKGVHHMALVCRDMEKTVDFYTNIMEMKLVKGFDLGGGYGQHFFFDMGGDNLLAFFWFADAAKAAPGVASAANLLGKGGTISSAHGSMNHVAFHAPLEKIEAFRDNLMAKGVECSQMINHADVETIPGETRTTDDVDDTTWVRSFYFLDPDGIMLEFCADVTPGTGDLTLPVNAEGVKADGSDLLG
ncbi:MAG: VOC family protein [Proteobacteria bacterium]|nr:VOC family protein [Pseudomonadota bacterium]